jgi:hypothetical protein
MRVALSIIETAKNNQASAFKTIQTKVTNARTKFDDALLQQGVDVTEKSAPVAKFASLAKRLDDVSKNLSESYEVATEGDEAKDEVRKETFRGMLQQSLVSYAQIILAMDEMCVVMQKDWKIKPDLKKPLELNDAESKEPVSDQNLGKYPIKKKLNPNKTQDLLKSIDLRSDTVAGIWKIKDEGLITSTHRNCNLRLPLPKDRSYRLEVDVQRTQGGPSGFFINISAFGFYGAVQIDGGDDKQRFSGLAKIDGKNALENGTGKKGNLFHLGETSSVVIEVREASVMVKVNNMDVVNWEGDVSQLAYPGSDQDRIENRTGIGANTSLDHTRVYRISRIELTEIDD